ncbi:MAG: YqfO family protein [Halioglobus sp.]|nr:YqfO family protein [Halioglobus sp.]
MHKLCFYVPETHVEDVKKAIFAAGAGRVGDYDSCSWQVLGQGQFRPLVGSTPFLGQVGAVETVVEYRVEMVCADECIRAAVAAMLDAHPYETPAWDVVAVVTELPQ